MVEHSAVKVWITWSIIHGRYICSLGYFPFQLVVHDWSIKNCRLCFPVCGKVYIKDPLLLIGKSSICGDNGFPLKKYVTMTICLTANSRWYESQYALERSLNKTNFPFPFHKMQCFTRGAISVHLASCGCAPAQEDVRPNRYAFPAFRYIKNNRYYWTREGDESVHFSVRSIEFRTLAENISSWNSI